MKNPKKSKRHLVPPGRHPSKLSQPAHALADTEWLGRMEQLARTFVGVNQPAPHLTHTECQELLELYVNDEQEGEDVAALYPAVWQHLQTCTVCSPVYRQLKEEMEELDLMSGKELSSSASYSPLALPERGAPWHTRIASQLLGENLSFSFLFSLNHIKNVLAPAPTLQLRSTAMAVEHTLLFELLTVGGENIVVKARFEPRGQLFDLHLQVVAQEPIAIGWRAQLKWGEREYHEDLPNGEGAIENVSAPASEPVSDAPSPNFCLTIEPLPPTGT